ncbi:MAG: class II fumarate hydratase [Acidimicrobiales bacterium]
MTQARRKAQPTKAGFRTEHDTMGDVLVPEDALWGAQTQRAVENFPISGEPIDAALIAALGLIKGAAAKANAELQVLPKGVATAIARAAGEVASGKHDHQFPIDVFQTGSGTSSNMNANEVIAGLATSRLGRPVHANDHVNASQSSNDVFPSALRVAAALAASRDLLPALEHLADVLVAKATDFDSVVKAGRTHLMDATPVTLGQEFGGYAAQVRAARERIVVGIRSVAELPLGGTAVGTGINAPKGFAAKTIATLADGLGLPFREASDHFAVQAAQDAVVGLSGDLRVAAVALAKIADDIRWMSSGPRAGLAEIHLPELQPGSSIMPGKVNPVLCEAVLQVVAQVVGNDVAVGWAGARGNFELNVHLPVIGRNVLQSIRLLANVSTVFADKAVAGIEADVERCRAYAEASPAVVTGLNPVIGYERAAAIVKRSLATGRSIRSLLEEDGDLSAAALDKALDVLTLTKGGVTK